MDDQIAESRSELNQTPNLDRLAKQGMRFASAYAASPRCTPSRAALLTGKSPAQLHMTFVNDGRGRKSISVSTMHSLVEPEFIVELPGTETTIGDMLKREGYATAHFGKWHLGRVSPSSHGFDESDGPTGNEGLTDNPKEIERMTGRGMDFITRQTKAGKPFYLQISHYPARGTGDVLAVTVAAVKQRLGGKLAGRRGQDDRRLVEIAANQDMDDSIGILLKEIDDLGIAGNTYVVFSADHGSQGRRANAPLSNGKGTVWEGGIRVPLIIRGPGVAPSTCSHVPTIGTDLLPTIAELAGVQSPWPKAIEGGSLVPVLLHAGNGDVKRSREELVFHFPHYDKDEYGPASAILLGDYKLIRFYIDGSLHLFNLKTDIAEQHNLAKEMPAKASELDAQLTGYLKAVGAQLPTRNPDFDPNQAREMLRPIEK
jgi:arylsulfatase A-like enzyme